MSKSLFTKTEKKRWKSIFSERKKMWKAAMAKHVANAKLPEDEKKRKLQELETAAWRAAYELSSFKERTCWGSVRLECMKELGFALLCFQHLHADVDWGKQPGRVKKLCEELAKEVGNPDLVYWNGLLDRIHEEIENLC